MSEPDWTTAFGSLGLALNAAPRREVLLYGRQPDPLPPPDQRVGARLTADSRCNRCGGRFLEGHALSVDLKPNMAGTARHTRCDDPKLERDPWGDA